MILPIPFIDINASFPFNPLHLSAIYGLYNSFEFALETQSNEDNYLKNINVNNYSYDAAKVLPNDERSDGLTALEFAIKYGQYYIFNQLLNNDQIEVSGKNSISRWRGNSPIHICAKFGRIRMLKILLEKKADQIDLNFQNLQCYTFNNVLTPKNGYSTALHLAVEFNQKEIVRILKDAGADLSKKKSFGKYCT